MEILGMIGAAVVIMGLIWLIVREDPNDKRVREYRAQQFIEGMRKAEARELAEVKTYVRPAAPKVYAKPVDTKPAKAQTSSSRSSRGSGSSYSRRDDDTVSSSYSWGGDSSYSSSSSSSSSCDSSSSSSSSSSCD